MKSVEVMLSTYNGEQYVRDQVESILNQTVPVHITARDDGSKDGTVRILRDFKDITVIKGENEGAAESFLSLISIAPKNDYYAFSDQDDVWDSDKLEVAIEELERYSDRPALYSGNRRLVDKEMRFISDETLNPKCTLGSAIVKNYASGCTIVFNKKLMDELKKYRPSGIPFHDWWVNLLCLSLGGVSFFDVAPHISYRQHGDNAVGGASTKWSKWSGRFRTFVHVRYHREIMADQILRAYGNDISAENRKLLSDCAEKHVIRNGAFRTGNRLDDSLFCLCAILGRI